MNAGDLVQTILVQVLAILIAAVILEFLRAVSSSQSYSTRVELVLVWIATKLRRIHIRPQTFAYALLALDVAFVIVLSLSLLDVIGIPVNALVVFLAYQVILVLLVMVYLAHVFRRRESHAALWLSESAAWDYVYGTYRVVYHIGTRSKGDRWIRNFEIKARGDILGIKTIAVGSTAVRNRGARTARALRLNAWTDKGIPRLLVARRNRTWYVTTIFPRPIKAGQTAQMKISGSLPNTWDDLRRSGEDQGEFNLANRAELLEIVVTFPEGVSGGDLAPRSPKTGEVTTSNDAQGRLQTIWTIKNAEPGPYRYLVTYPKLPKLSARKA